MGAQDDGGAGEGGSAGAAVEEGVGGSCSSSGEPSQGGEAALEWCKGVL